MTMTMWGYDIYIISKAKPFQMSKRIGDYLINTKHVIGTGSYGQVCRGEHEKTKQKCAVKILSKQKINSDEYLKNAVIQEIEILQTLASENIVQVYDVMESANNYYIIQQLCDSDLETHLKKLKVIPEEQAIQILTQIVNAFLTLTQEGIIHRDLKPANILIAKGKMKLADFGFAKRGVSRKMKAQTAIGTPLYMSIEVLKAEPYTSKCDVWGIGFIFYEMLHGRTPWTAHFSEYELIKNIEKIPLKIDKGFKFDTIDFLNKVLQVNEQDRLSWDEVFRHDIFEGYFDKFLAQNQQIQNKLKSVMGQLRFKLTEQNINIARVFEMMGFDPKQELNPQQFERFIKSITPNITSKEVRFFFDKIDDNSNGAVSIQEIEMQIQKLNTTKSKIKRKLTDNRIPVPEMGSPSSPTPMGSELEAKAKLCFTKLFKVLRYKRMSLKKLFNTYDREGKGNMNFECFSKMIAGLKQDISQGQMQILFDFIDVDGSKTVEFDEFYPFYCKVNGIPQNLDELAEGNSPLKK